MTFLEILVILLIAVFITGVFVFLIKNNGPWSILIFFLIIFLASWAARLWIVPVGPLLWGIAWIPILTVGVIFAFILAAAMKPKNPRKEIMEKQVGVETDEDKTSSALGAFFWVLIIILLIAVIIGQALRN